MVDDNYLVDLARKAQAASRIMAMAVTGQKNRALIAMADAIDEQAQSILSANDEDMAEAKKTQLSDALKDRLELNASRIHSMTAGLRHIAELPDPVGQISNLSRQASGIEVGKMRVPLGVIGIVYESRPGVTADAAGLCVKAGNAVILRGGSEAKYSNRAIARCLAAGLKKAGLPETGVCLIEVTDRGLVSRMAGMDQYIDLLVPRGGKGLIKEIMKHARVPVLKHLDGVCHVYVAADADMDMAVQIVFNAKTQRYGTCNTMESLLIDRDIAAPLLSRLGPELDKAGVEVRGCAVTCQRLSNAKPATDEDYATEYLGPFLSVRVVDGLEQAMDHIDRFGSRHTDAIVTSRWDKALRFLREVDSSSVIVNASTRFADGFEYGLGAEIGISTDKFHARGPVGLEGLTTQKFVVFGSGQIRV